MVLMAADNLPNEEPLAGFAEEDLREMEAVGSVPGVLNIVVQIDRKGAREGPARYYIGRGKRQALRKRNDRVPFRIEASGPDVLQDFVIWAARNYPADHYMLVLWGHAYRLAFNRDPEAPEGLDFADVADVLAASTNGTKLDIVAFDSCNVSLVEGAYQLRNVANYLVASQFTDPLPGWPYEAILGKIARAPDHFAGPDGPKDFVRALVSQFAQHYERDASVTMTALDLARAEEIGDRMSDLAGQLTLAVAGDRGELETVKSLFQRSQVPEDQPSIDLATFCWNLLNFSGSESVRVAAAALGTSLLRPSAPFVVAHARTDTLVSMLQGVSAFAPNVVRGNGFDAEPLRPVYERLDLAQHTMWGRLAFALAHS